MTWTAGVSSVVLSPAFAVAGSTGRKNGRSIQRFDAGFALIFAPEEDTVSLPGNVSDV
jgi:hypothetical protein